MDDLYETGKWVINNLGFLERKRSETKRRCIHCQKVGEMEVMTYLAANDVPFKDQGFYHPECVRQLFGDPYTCVICGCNYLMLSIYYNRELCKKCYKGIYKVQYDNIQKQGLRATKNGLQFTLTLKEWLQTLNDFGWCCAYCEENSYYAIDHFIPINRGGGTTSDNCIPACKNCNGHKYNKDPFKSNMMNVDKIAAYLRNR